MSDSILDTIKQMLGIPTTDTAFDVDITVGINSAFMTLNQLGVGPTEVYYIEDKDDTWADFLGEEEDSYPGVKAYTYISTKMLFDPPATSFVLEALSRQKQELEWRLNIQVPIPETPVDPEP